VPAIGVYQEIGLDPSHLEHLNPQAYLDQVRDLPPVREGVLRHLDLFGLAENSGRIRNAGADSCTRWTLKNLRIWKGTDREEPQNLRAARQR